MSQELVENMPATSITTSDSALDERVNRLQTALEILIQKVDSLERSGPSPRSSETRGSSSLDIITPMSSPSNASVTVPPAPMFENPVVGHLYLHYLSDSL